MYNKPISYSGKSLFKQCPKKWHNQYILGNRGPSNPAAERGTRLHEQLEKFFMGGVFPRGIVVLRPWRQFMEALTLESPSPEAELAVLSDWTPTTFDDEGAYYRGKADLQYIKDDTLHIFDWKSGRVYPEHSEQGLSYVAMGAEVENYKTYFVYLDSPLTVHTYDYTAKQRLEEQEKLSEEIEVIRLAEDYPGTPNQYCRYCPMNWRTGGECHAAP